MKFGVIYNTGHHGVDPDGMIAVARHAEDRGFESFYPARARRAVTGRERR